MRMQDKVVMITGGARGIGRATVLKFASEGATVCWCDLDTDANKALHEELKGEPHSYHHVNVTDRNAVREWVQQVVDKHGRIDVLVNNAGITRDNFLVKVKNGELVKEMPEEEFDQVIDINLKGVFNCTQAVAPVMIKQQSGVILSASSVVGLYGNLGQTNYVATKAGVIGMTQVWARELGRYNIRVNAVSPGFIATEMVKKIPEKIIAGIAGKTPMNRLGEPRELANVYLWLASDEASFVSGANISVDGGLVWGTQMQYQNIYQMLCATVDRCAESAAYFHKVNGDWQTVTWKEFKDLSDSFALALLKQGLKPGDTVSVLAGNDLVWPVADVGTIAAGGIGVGIYPSSSPEQCAYILKHSNSKFVVVDSEQQLQKIVQIRDQIPGLTIISKVAHANAILWDDFLQQGDRGVWDSYQKTANSRGYDDTVVIVYTSGTTGHPKGACLSNRYVIASCEALDKVFEAVRNDTFIENADDQFITLSFLPFCHVAERISGMYARMYSGFSAYLIDNIAKLFSYMQELSPHMFGGLPRFYEKIYAKILDDVENGKINKEDFDKAIAINKKVITQRDDNQTLTSELYEEWKWAEENVYSKVRSSFGSRIVSCSSGAAPIPKEVLDLFLYAGNLTILEAYGLTEYVCCAFSTPRAHRANSVGKPMHGCEVKIAEDGEILLKGPQMFSGYYNDETATKEVIDEEGWLHTGDIGKLDEDNFLYITGRKKEFIKTSTGKKIAPLYIENLCKRNHLLSNIMVYGDNKKYLTALITLNEVELRSYAKVHNIAFDNYAALTKNPKIQEIVTKVIDEVNAQVSRTEQIKKYTVLEKDFSVEGDEITPTGKVKRRIVNKKYHDIIESMYA